MLKKMANKWIMMMPQVEMKTFCFLKDFSMQEWNSLSLESILSLSDRCLPSSRHTYFIRTHAMIT